jgi:hypothetical protein
MNWFDPHRRSHRRPKSLLILVLAAAFTIAGLDGASAGQITFQGLSGSSLRGDVQGVFPGAVQERQLGCKQGEVSQTVGPERVELSCDGLRVSAYDVLGTKFDVSFTFDSRTKKLLFVNLVHWWAFPNDASSGTRLTKSEIMAQYTQLRTILISNHGAPRNDESFCQTDNGRILQLCDKWQGSPSAAPDESLGSVELKVYAGKAGPSDPTYSGDFSISYVLTPQFKGL